MTLSSSAAVLLLRNLEAAGGQLVGINRARGSVADARAGRVARSNEGALLVTRSSIFLGLALSWSLVVRNDRPPCHLAITPALLDMNKRTGRAERLARLM